MSAQIAYQHKSKESLHQYYFMSFYSVYVFRIFTPPSSMILSMIFTSHTYSEFCSGFTIILTLCCLFAPSWKLFTKGLYTHKFKAHITGGVCANQPDKLIYIYIYNWCDNFSKSPSLMFFFLNLGWFTVLQAGSIVTSPCRYTYMYIQSSPTGSGWHGFLSLRPKVREAAALQTTATPTCPDTLETWDEYDRLDMDPWFWEDDLKWILYDSVYKQPISSPWCNENISERFDDLKSDTSLKCLSGVADCQIVRLSEPWLFCWIFADAAFWGSVGRLKHKHGFPPTIWWVWGECFSGLTV